MENTAPEICDYCDLPLPLGCGHIDGKSPECKVGERKDIEWRIGIAIWNNLCDRRGIKHELMECDLEIQIEIIETMGKLAKAEIEKPTK